MCKCVALKQVNPRGLKKTLVKLRDKITQLGEADNTSIPGRISVSVQLSIVSVRKQKAFKIRHNLAEVFKNNF